ncbi:MAG TPA: hypothetical protein VML94_06815 [Thermoplasmata archaeon]|nr:hypothetical protein [Thermoplasmata archaeon]
MNDPNQPLPYGPPGRGPYAPVHAYRWVLLAAVAVAAIVTVGVVLWLVLPRSHGYGGYWFPLGGFFLVFVVIWAAFFAIRMSFWSSRRQQYRAARYGGGPYGGPRFDPAIRTARLRYARGEITRQQYDEIVRGLRPGPPPP